MKYTLHIISFVFVIFLGATPLLAQDACGTNEADQHTSYFNNKEMIIPKRQFKRAAFVPIKFHIISATTGAFGIDSSEVFDELVHVNAQFAGAGIEFVHCGNINYIKNNAFINFEQYASETICDENDVFDVVNIYFVPTIIDDDGDGTLCGYAYNFDVKQRLIMANGCSTNGSTLTHELGHTFSLAHTHRTSQGRELVDGSNCAIAGDRLCDTPADPRLGSSVVNNSCIYIGTDTDANGDAYAPDPSNIMSYSRKSCRNSMSDGQLDVIADFYNKIAFQFYCESLPTSTKVTEFEQVTQVFPNPVDQELKIESEIPFQNIEILDLTGQSVYRNNLNVAVKTFSLSTGHLPLGTFIVVVKSNNKISSKIITKLF